MKIEELLLWGGVLVIVGGLAYFYISKNGVPTLPGTGGGGTGTTPGGGGGTGTAGKDRWGITKLHPSVGREWYSKWDNGHARSWASKGLSQRNADPDDPESDLHADTNGSKCSVDGKGKMVMEGSNPRMYINSPNKKWQNVEMTIYFKSLRADPRGSISVFSRLSARSEHQLEFKCSGSGRTMGGFEIKSNGIVQLRKEITHPNYAPDVKASIKGPGRNVRWGMKLVLRNKGKAILSQCYVDTKANNNWEKVIERLDSGTPAPTSTDLCKAISSNAIWLEPATSCYLRCDGNVMEFSNFSIREIAPA